MDLIEGISNDVVLAFFATLSLVFITVYFLISRNNSGDSERTQVDSGNNESSVQDNGDVQGNTTSESADNASSSGEYLRQRREPTRTSDMGSSVRDSSVNDGSVTMQVKVKHNENMRSFTVSTNCIVIDLKRLAFPDELNSGKRVRFVFAGQLLRSDNETLTSYGVQDNTVIHCVITDPPEQTNTVTEENEDDLDLSHFLIPLLTVGLVLSWYGLITYKHIFTGSSIAILTFLTSLYFILVYVMTVQ